MTDRFMIEKSKNTSKVLSAVTAGLDVSVKIETTYEDAYLFEVEYEDPKDYVLILERLTNRYAFS